MEWNQLKISLRNYRNIINLDNKLIFARFSKMSNIRISPNTFSTTVTKHAMIFNKIFRNFNSLPSEKSQNSTPPNPRFFQAKKILSFSHFRVYLSTQKISTSPYPPHHFSHTPRTTYKTNICDSLYHADTEFIQPNNGASSRISEPNVRYEFDRSRLDIDEQKP